MNNKIPIVIISHRIPCLRTTAFRHRLDNSRIIFIEIVSPNTFLFPLTVQSFVYI